MEIEKIISIFKKSIINQYFLYALIMLAIIVTIKSLRDYKLYLIDCKILNQKPKPIGFTINSIFSYAQLSILISFIAIGYTAYNQKDDILKNNSYTIKTETTNKKVEHRSENKNLKIEKIIKTNKPQAPITKEIKIAKINKPPQHKKRLSKKELAKLKLKRELEAAIREVDAE